jgi:hypothetical protein
MVAVSTATVVAAWLLPIAQSPVTQQGMMAAESTAWVAVQELPTVQ